MLPSVSAGSAALTNYAKAIAAAAPDQGAQDGDNAPHTEQDAARQNADPRAAHAAASGALAREARETVERILDMMRLRVLTTLLNLDVPRQIAVDAAIAAATKLAEALSTDGRHAAEIVHALLERPATANANPTAALLQLTARELAVVVDHETGDIRIEMPSVTIAPGKQPATTAETHHLIDFTDRSPAQAAPALAALAAVQETARAADLQSFRLNQDTSAAPAGTARVVVSPDVFQKAVAARLSTLIDNGNAAPNLPVSEVAAAVARITVSTLNTSAPMARAVSIPEIVASFSRLEAIGSQSNATPAQTPVAFGHGKIAISADTQSGVVTLRIGQRVTAFAPASLSSPAAAAAPLPEVNALPLPIVDIPANLPTGRIVETPNGLPFVPPEVTDLPAPGRPAPPSPNGVPAKPANAADHAIPSDTPDTAASSIAVMARNASILKQVETASQGDTVRLTRVSMDISAEIAPGAQTAQQPSPVGGFGLPRPAPAPGEDGPVLPRGYADASANLVPVLPAFHSRGLMPVVENKSKHRKSAKGQYNPALLENAFDRDTPQGHEGLVFSAVVFTA